MTKSLMVVFSILLICLLALISGAEIHLDKGEYNEIVIDKLNLLQKENPLINQEMLSILMSRLNELTDQVTDLKLKVEFLVNENRKEQREYVEDDELTMKRNEFLMLKSPSLPKENSARVPPAIPRSCRDLQFAGLNIVGLHLVAENHVERGDTIKVVYCDFTQLPTVTEYETTIGYVDVKTLPNQFYVERSSNYGSMLTEIVPFEVERWNLGNAMNSDTGIFTAPVSGVYFFSFSGIKSADNFPMTVEISKNGETIGASHCSVGVTEQACSLQAILPVLEGDKVYLTHTGSELSSSPSQITTHFNGFLLMEALDFLP